MLKPLDKDAAFPAIAEDLELPLVLLSNPDLRVRFFMLDEIGAALAGTNLTFRDLAERVTAPRTPMPMTPDWPASQIVVDGHGDAAPHRPITAEAVLTNAELRRLGGYRTEPSDGYGYDGTPIPGADAPQHPG